MADNLLEIDLIPYKYFQTNHGWSDTSDHRLERISWKALHGLSLVMRKSVLNLWSLKSWSVNNWTLDVPSDMLVVKDWGTKIAVNLGSNLLKVLSNPQNAVCN